MEWKKFFMSQRTYFITDSNINSKQVNKKTNIDFEARDDFILSYAWTHDLSPNPLHLDSFIILQLFTI